MNSYFQKIEQFEHEILHHSQQLENRLADLTLKETPVQASEICLHFFMSIREGVNLVFGPISTDIKNKGTYFNKSPPH